MNLGLSFLLPVLFLMALALLVAGVAYLVLKVRTGQPFELSFHLILSIYLYLMSVISLLVLAVGLSSLVNLGMALGFGREFSYTAPPLYPTAAYPPGAAPERAPPVEDQRLQRERELDDNFRNGLAEGVALTAVGGLSWALHTWGRHALYHRPAGEQAFLRRIYLAVLLIIFSVGGIIALSQGMTDTVRYIMIGGADPYSFRPAPGGSLSTAIVFVPIWIYCFTALWRERRTGEARP